MKESDRIELVSEGLSAMGADITPLDDGFLIKGGKGLCGADIRTEKDHRIALSFTIAGLVSDGPVLLDDPGCVSISYPGFYKDLERLAP